MQLTLATKFSIQMLTSSLLDSVIIPCKLRLSRFWLCSLDYSFFFTLSSAYSIFNEGFRELPGTLNAERIDRDIRAGQF